MLDKEQWSIVLTNGNVLKIKANHCEFAKDTNAVRFYKDNTVVARINMDNIVGWFNDYCVLRKE